MIDGNSSCLLTHSHTMTPFACLGKKPFQNTVGKGENAGNQHFLLLPQCFLLYQRQKLSFMLHCSLSSANAFNLDNVNFLSSLEWVYENLFDPSRPKLFQILTLVR